MYPDTPRVREALQTTIFSWTIIPQLIDESDDPEERQALHDIMVNRSLEEEHLND